MFHKGGTTKEGDARPLAFVKAAYIFLFIVLLTGKVRGNEKKYLGSNACFSMNSNDLRRIRTNSNKLQGIRMNFKEFEWISRNLNEFTLIWLNLTWKVGSKLKRLKISLICKVISRFESILVKFSQKFPFFGFFCQYLSIWPLLVI